MADDRPVGDSNLSQSLDGKYKPLINIIIQYYIIHRRIRANDVTIFYCVHSLFVSGNDGTAEKSVGNNQPEPVHCSIAGPGHNRLLLFDFHDAAGTYTPLYNNHHAIDLGRLHDGHGANNSRPPVVALFSDHTQIGGVLQRTKPKFHRSIGRRKSDHAGEHLSTFI